MRPTRRTQPYRRGARAPGQALAAMLRGRTLYGHNPMDLRRGMHRRPRLKDWLR